MYLNIGIISANLLQTAILLTVTRALYLQDKLSQEKNMTFENSIRHYKRSYSYFLLDAHNRCLFSCTNRTSSTGNQRPTVALGYIYQYSNDEIRSQFTKNAEDAPLPAKTHGETSKQPGLFKRLLKISARSFLR